MLRDVEGVVPYIFEDKKRDKVTGDVLSGEFENIAKCEHRI